MSDTPTLSSKETLLQHGLYGNMQSVRDIQLFMESHVFAVWDFMSLLKTLQQKLTCTQIPWVPMGSASTRFFINEIVLGEESDVDLSGGYTSHFELYLKAMKETGANTQPIEDFINALRQGKSVEASLIIANAPHEAAEFVKMTFELIHSKSIHELAALFTYGREDLIPGMFISMVESLNEDHQNLSTFIYYLKRHIELDGDHHGQLSEQMTQELIDGNSQRQEEVNNIIDLGYRQRIQLWNGIDARIMAERRK